LINRIVISGYRCFKHLDLEPNPGLNIVVGDNECGKSTLLEAIALGLTGKINGRWAVEELNPFWFHRQSVLDFFAAYARNEPIEPPTISIELYFASDIDAVQRFRGVHNSEQKDCPGVAISISPAEDYRVELDAYLASSPPAILPVEYYEVNWHSFADQRLAKRPRELATSYIDSRTIRSTAGVDYHTREMLSEHLDGQERAAISLAHRRSRQTITEDTLGAINERIGRDSQQLHHKPIGLQMDQSSRSSWEAGVVPQVEDIPFAMSGQGQQSAIKMSLAMSRTAGASTFVLIEEPENHLSHTSLTRLISRIDSLAGDDQQLFICTHSSFVANRLGLDKLILLNLGTTAKLSSLSADTVSYFRRLAGYDTLRLVLANHVVLVEGPSDVIVFERAFRDTVGKLPSELGIDIMSMGGLTSRRALEVCRALKRRAIALQDNDGHAPEEIKKALSDLLENGERELFVGEPNDGSTLEPQLLSANTSESLRKVLNLKDPVDPLEWMGNNKTEMAIRIFDSKERISMPTYIQEAIAFLRQHT
jgi:energy-coupling factor transporter ATP-binding protein EcfA2